MRRSLTIYVALISLVLSYIQTSAQDHIYSQFFNAPVYLNPALNGQFNGDLRLNMIYRNQWSTIPGDLTYLTASIDYQIPQFGGGIGLMFNRSNEGTAYLTKNSVSSTYSYSIGSDAYILSFGVQAGIANNKIDQTKLIFYDQIDAGMGFIPGSSSAITNLQYNNRFYFDSGAGINLVLGNLMLGGAVQHLNRPDVSFTGSKSLLALRTTAHGSYRISLGDSDYESDGSYIIPSVVVYEHNKSVSMSGGLQFKRQSMNAGVWYRSNKRDGNDALVVSLIFDLFTNSYKDEKIRIGISHDATTSKLNYANTSGTTEGSLSYETTFPSRGNGYRKFDNSVNCYDFY